MADTENPTGTESTLDQMAAELRELEGGRKPKWGKWIFVLGIAVIAGMVYILMARPAAPRAGIQKGVAIEMQKPAKGPLSAAPARFEWESVTGRSEYRLTVTRVNAMAPLIDKKVKESSIDLSGGEAAQLTRGATYIWRVEALDKDGKVLGSGESHFAL